MYTTKQCFHKNVTQSIYIFKCDILIQIWIFVIRINNKADNLMKFETYITCFSIICQNTTINIEIVASLIINLLSQSFLISECNWEYWVTNVIYMGWTIDDVICTSMFHVLLNMGLWHSYHLILRISIFNLVKVWKTSLFCALKYVTLCIN